MIEFYISFRNLLYWYPKLKYGGKLMKKYSSIYELDGRVPVLEAIPFGLQHILAMFVANITPIIII